MPASPPVPPTSIFKMQLQLNVRLSPYFSRNVRVGVENLLNKALLRHVPEAGGILLAYENLQLADRAAKIVHEGCEAHFRIRCDALVFRVRRGTLLAGTVNKISSNHIGLLVYGLFNASIAVDELRYGLHFDTESGGAWVEDSAIAAFGEGGGGSDSDDSGGGSPAAGDAGASSASSSGGGPRVQFKAGTKMLFQVQGLRSNAGLVSIAGTMRLADAHKAAAEALEQREAKRQAKDDARARIAAARAEKVAAAAASAAAAIEANAPSEEEDAEAAAVLEDGNGGGGGGDDDDDDDDGDDDDDDDDDDDARTPRKKKAKAHVGDGGGGSGSGSSARSEKKKDKKKKKKDKKKKRDKSEKKPKKRKHASD